MIVLFFIQYFILVKASYMLTLSESIINYTTCQRREFVNAIKATSVTKPDFFIYKINIVIIVKQNEQYRDSCYTTSLMQLDA